MKNHLQRQTYGLERFKVQYEELKGFYKQKIFYEVNKLTDEEIF